MTEKEYRNLKIDSYSSIKVFLEDRKKYYKKFILQEPIREEDSASLLTGSLVDCLLFTPSEFEDRYTLAVSQVPTGQYGKFVEELMHVTIRNTNTSTGEVLKDVEDMIEDAYNAVKFDRTGNIVNFKRDSLETVKRKFVGTDLEMHYRQLRESHGKTVIELSTLENAQRIINELKSNFVSAPIINAKDDGNTSVYDQFPIVGQLSADITKSVPFDIKCLPDRLIVKHLRKEIHIWDFKTTWDNENEFLTNYFKYKYYVQAAIYFYLVVEWKKKQKGLEDYSVFYPKFLVAESNNYKNPLIYKTSETNFNQAMRGFESRGKWHTGVVQAVKDLMWHKEMGIWNISRDNYLADGIVSIAPF